MAHGSGVPMRVWTQDGMAWHLYLASLCLIPRAQFVAAGASHCSMMPLSPVNFVESRTTVDSSVAPLDNDPDDRPVRGSAVPNLRTGAFDLAQPQDLISSLLLALEASSKSSRG